jgi:hypothetical protein
MANRLIPSGQSEGSVDLGAYSFTGVTSVSLPNNVFSTAFDNYQIHMNFKQITSAGNLSIRFRSAGSDIATSAYYMGAQGWSSAGAAINRSVSNGSAFILNGATTQKADGAFTNTANVLIANPLSGERKNVIYDFTYWNSSDVQNSLTGGGFNSTGSVGDSLTFLTSAGTMTGTVYVYGMRK